MKQSPITSTAAPGAPVSEISPALRRFLYFTAAVTGGAIMIIEILGAKMLAPYVGTSHFVWTAQITVTLLALAGGYQLGGWLVDRSQKLNRLYGAILGAAVYLCAIPLVIEPVAYACLNMKESSLGVGSLMASGILFFVPLGLLAMTGPYMVRILTVSVSGVGGNMGRLTAVSTMGSVIGTLLISYWLIPNMPNTTSLYLTAGLLLVIAIVYFAGWHRKTRAMPLIAILVCVGLGSGQAWQMNRPKDPNFVEIFRANSHFGQLQVFDGIGGRRFYLNDFLWQNTYVPKTHRSDSMFSYMLHGLAKACTPKVEQVLCIGLGVGAVPMQFANEGVRVDVVEINPAVVPMGVKYFDLQTNKLHLQIGDGRTYLHKITSRYDVIALDAFLGDSSPSHLMTKEAFGEMSRALKPDGVLVINSFSNFSPDADFLGTSLNKTLKAVFRNVAVYTAGNGNVFFVATNQPELKFLHPPSLEGVPEHLVATVQAAFDGLQKVDETRGMVLTDNFNPVEFRDAKNRETIRRGLAMRMKM